MEQLKQQVIMLSAVNGSKDSNNVFGTIVGIILLTVIEQIFKVIPMIIEEFKTRFTV
jgi:hypothetical protein